MYHLMYWDSTAKRWQYAGTFSTVKSVRAALAVHNRNWFYDYPSTEIIFAKNGEVGQAYNAQFGLVSRHEDFIVPEQRPSLLEDLYQECERIFQEGEMYLEGGSYPPRNRSDESMTDISYGDVRAIMGILIKLRQTE